MQSSCYPIPRSISVLILFLFYGLQAIAQSSAYEEKKKEKLAIPSPFEAIIDGDNQDQIVYQNEYVVAFVPLRKQAPLHLLIVPKKRIPSINEAIDEIMLGQLLLAAKKLAVDNGIDQTGYRIAINTNENAGQSVFHLHVHLLGGMPLGPMVEQTYTEK